MSALGRGLPVSWYLTFWRTASHFGKQAKKERLLLTALKNIEKISIYDLSKIFNLSEGRIRAILLEIVKEGIIQKMGKTKSAYYVLK